MIAIDQADTAAWLDAGGPDSDAQDDDEDLKSDPIAQIDLAVSLRSGVLDGEIELMVVSSHRHAEALLRGQCEWDS